MYSLMPRRGFFQRFILTQHRERVRLGQEPPLSDIQGRVIRLSGSHSPMTEVSMTRMGEHIMPVYEKPPKVFNINARRYFDTQSIIIQCGIATHREWRDYRTT